MGKYNQLGNKIRNHRVKNKDGGGKRGGKFGRMRRGGRIGGFDPTGKLKCKARYGFANGWFYNLEERASLLNGLTISICGQCPKTRTCGAQTFAKGNIGDNPQKAIMLLFANEIEGAIARTCSDAREANPEFKPTKKDAEELIAPLDYKEIGEQLGCSGKYGYGFGLLFTEDIPLCRICPEADECLKASFEQYLDVEPEKQEVTRASNIMILVANVQKGTQDRMKGIEIKSVKRESENDGTSASAEKA